MMMMRSIRKCIQDFFFVSLREHCKCVKKNDKKIASSDSCLKLIFLELEKVILLCEIKYILRCELRVTRYARESAELLSILVELAVAPRTNDMVFCKSCVTLYVYSY